MRAGARDVASDVALWLAPALARASTPDQREWQEAFQLAEETKQYKLTYDEFGVAEAQLHLATLVAVTDPARAEREAQDARALFARIDNPLGVGNALKAIARIHLRKAGVVW